VVSAEIPDPIADPELHELVTGHMLHAMCDECEDYGCRHDENGVVCPCIRHYPKEMSRETAIIPDGYPMYMRRGRFQATVRGGRIISDNWVVPYNAYLLRRYRSHMNVEVSISHATHHFMTRDASHITHYMASCNPQVCAHFRCFKYVYKYTFKPPDHTAVTVDEINAHLAGRLLTVSEATHRLLGLTLHDEWPNVVRLDIHLPRQQRMVFDPTADEIDLLEQLTATTSTLMGWFSLNADDVNARQHLYHDIPAHYTWRDSVWHARVYKGVQSVGRVFGVSHFNGELFAMRRLLSVVRGAVSFEDLATVEGVVYSTFRSACMARGMMNGDSELEAALREIIETVVSLSSIRRHFAQLLVHSAPADPQALFNMFVDDLCDQNDGGDAVNVALLSIDAHMIEMGRSLSDAEFGFILPDSVDLERPRRRRRTDDAARLVLDSIRHRDAILPMFTGEQTHALHDIIEAIQSDRDIKVFALIASAGVGKTVFANGLTASLRAQNKTVVCVAASALAAGLLLDGSTAHSSFHIPIPANEGTTCNLSRADRIALRDADLIIWDECSMVTAYGYLLHSFSASNNLSGALRCCKHCGKNFARCYE
jgi:hypothetical protein